MNAWVFVEGLGDEGNNIFGKMNNICALANLMHVVVPYFWVKNEPTKTIAYLQ